MIKLVFRFVFLCFLVLSLNSFGAQTDSLVNIELEPLITKKIATMKLTRLVLPLPQQLISNDATLQLTTGIETIKAKFSIVNAWPTTKQDVIKKTDKVSSANYIRLMFIEVEQQTLPSNNITLYWRNHQNNKLTNVASLKEGGCYSYFSNEELVSTVIVIAPRI